MMMRHFKYKKQLSLLFLLLMLFGLGLFLRNSTGNVNRKEIFINSSAPVDAQVREVIISDNFKKILLLDVPQVFSMDGNHDVFKVSDISVISPQGNNLKKLVIPFSTKKLIVFTEPDYSFLTLNFQLSDWGIKNEDKYNYLFTIKDKLDNGVKIHQTFSNGYVESTRCTSTTTCSVSDMEQEVVYSVSNLVNRIDTQSEVIWNQDFVSGLRTENQTLTFIRVYFLDFIVSVVIIIVLIFLFNSLKNRYDLIVRKKGEN